ncbi:MAG TPA: hypothetical protein VN181_16580 [Thermoanaerobaculia bacterium]|nr:hypothetical protein [Thermoanaerobaculia bacterium]
MPTINIVRDTSGSVSFAPSTTQLVGGDFVIWVNQDPQSDHHPTQAGEPADYWMNNPLPSAVAGQPFATSPAIILSGPEPISYVDAIDSAIVPGTITFA